MGVNKVRFGLKNVHYAIVTETTVGGVTTSSYDTPVAIPGAVHLTRDAESSDPSIFRADDSDYYIVKGSTSGFSGELEIAEVPEAFDEDVLGSALDQNDVSVETANDVTKYVALLYEVNGDDSARRYMIPKCLFSRPSIDAETTGEDGNEPKTTTLNFTASPRPDDGLSRLKTTSTTDAAVYSGWFSSVYTPTF